MLKEKEKAEIFVLGVKALWAISKGYLKVAKVHYDCLPFFLLLQIAWSGILQNEDEQQQSGGGGGRGKERIVA